MGTADAGGAASFFDDGFGGRGGNGTAAAATAKTKQQLGSVLNTPAGLPWHTECLHTLGSVLTYCWFTLAHCRVHHTLGSILTHYLVYPNTGEHLYIQEYI